jgi:hypothetical protein
VAGRRIVAARTAAILLLVVAGPRGAGARSGEATPPPSPTRTHAIPEISGPGRVTTAGRLWMKTTNIGYMGNPFPALSSDPGGQWPGPSGVEYLYNWSLWVGAKVRGATAGAPPYRVSAGIEWRPPSLDPEDRIHRAFEGQYGGLRDYDDDADGRYDEEWLNGRDDDADGRVDEDFAAYSQSMDALEMRDDTPQSLGGTDLEVHTPIGLRVRQRTLSFADGAPADFVGVEYLVTNMTADVLDSVFVGFLVDQDLGPVTRNGYWLDDLPEPRVPQQDLSFPMPPTDPRYDARRDFEHPAGFCTVDRVAVRGFTMADDDGDGGDTPGSAAFLLLDHSTDVRGRVAPRQVGFRAFHMLRAVAPFNQGGVPTVDLDRYALLSRPEGTSGGRITASPPAFADRDDYLSFGSVGPFARVGPGETIRVVVGYLVVATEYALPRDDANGQPHPERYGALKAAALELQLLYRGRYETATPGALTTPVRGWETPLLAPPGMPYLDRDCHSDSTGDGTRPVGDRQYAWFDFDCDACTGIPGVELRPWMIGGPPPNPAMRVTPLDRSIRIEWDNRGETVADRVTGVFDSTAYRRGAFNAWAYQVWRASDYTRPVGTIGPTDDLWQMVGEFVIHDAVRPLVDSLDTGGDGRFDAIVRTAPLLLNRETGQRLVPFDVPVVRDTLTGDTLFAIAERRGIDPERGLVVAPAFRVPIYPVGRYTYVDTGLLNGFVYYYSVVAVDSIGAPGPGGAPGSVQKREGRHFALESAGTSPQAASVAPAAGGVYVVPNPYRGRAAWDVTPNAADPTGTHVDFYGMPRGPWTIRIFTLAGDLVQTLRHTDVLVGGRAQQDDPSDGQARWDLLSRNGQDVASGIYLFAVESGGPVQRGKFVLIR